MPIIRLPEGVSLQNLLWGIFEAGEASANAPEVAEGDEHTAEDYEFQAKDLMRELTSRLEAEAK